MNSVASSSPPKFKKPEGLPSQVSCAFGPFPFHAITIAYRSICRCSLINRLDRVRAIAAANSRSCATGGGYAVAVTVGVLDVVEGQDPRGWIVAALVDEVNGHAAAGAAAMLKHLVGEGTDLFQREGGPLREEADPPSVDVAAEAEAARHTILLGPGGDGHWLIDTDADDMVATVVDGRVVLVRGPDCVSQDLYD